MFDKILRVMAICDVSSVISALMSGGQAFRVKRGQDITGRQIERELQNAGIKTRGWLVDSLRNEIRFAVSKSMADDTAHLLSSLGVDWW